MYQVGLHAPSLLIKVPARRVNPQMKKTDAIPQTTTILTHQNRIQKSASTDKTNPPIIPTQKIQGKYIPQPPSTARSTKPQIQNQKTIVSQPRSPPREPPVSARPAPRKNQSRRRSPPKYNGPIDPNYFLNTYPDYLTDLEKTEILQYKEIYYVRQYPVTKKTYDAIVPQHFQYVSKEHIDFRFQMLQVVGKGSFGGVIKCADFKNNGKIVAVKFLRDNKKHHDQIVIENDFLEKLQHDNGPERHHIIKTYETFSYRGFFAIVMELGHNDVYNTLSAQNFLGLSITTIQLVTRQAANALRFIHSKGIIHCDFKPENILFMNQRKTLIKMIDFGCSSDQNHLIYTYIQSRFYRAPEVVFGCHYGPPIDVWGLGCVLCEMLTGKPLFEAEDECELMQLYQKILGPPPQWMINQGTRSGYYFHEDGSPNLEPTTDGAVHTPNSSSIEKETGINDKLFLSLVKGCLTWDPNERITPEQILSHPWMMHKYDLQRSKE